MITNDAKAKLLVAFDVTQFAYETLMKRREERMTAERNEQEAQQRYDRAKENWNQALKVCSPGDIGTNK